MKLIEASKDRLVFRFGHAERRLFSRVLGHYPCLPPAHHKPGKSGPIPTASASQRLLEDALAESRNENRKKLQSLLKDEGHFKREPAGWRVSLAPGEFEWLLQILNDIRVGSWVLLGSPEELAGPLEETDVPHFWTMEMAGAFQMQFLALMETGAAP